MSTEVTTTEKYDSTADTLKHIMRIQELIHRAIVNLCERGDKHDRSKLSPAEKAVFDEFTPKLKNSTYGSDEYKSYLESMKSALDNHYEENKNHHPDRLENGIESMDLMDLVEMIIDWKAATERHDNGDLYKSIEINQKRFSMSDQLTRIFNNSAYTMFGLVKERNCLEIRKYLNEEMIGITRIDSNPRHFNVQEFVNSTLNQTTDLKKGTLSLEENLLNVAWTSNSSTIKNFQGKIDTVSFDVRLFKNGKPEEKVTYLTGTFIQNFNDTGNRKKDYVEVFNKFTDWLRGIFDSPCSGELRFFGGDGVKEVEAKISSAGEHYFKMIQSSEAVTADVATDDDKWYPSLDDAIKSVIDDSQDRSVNHGT